MSTAPLPAPLRFILVAHRCESQQLEELALNCELVALASDLVHHLQRERGFTAIFLGTGATTYHEALDHRAAATDASEQRPHDHLRAWRAPSARSARLLDRIDGTLYLLDELPRLCRRIRDLRIDVQGATAAFLHLIGNLLAVIYAAADNASDPGLSPTREALFSCKARSWPARAGSPE